MWSLPSQGSPAHGETLVFQLPGGEAIWQELPERGAVD